MATIDKSAPRLVAGDLARQQRQRHLLGGQCLARRADLCRPAGPASAGSTADEAVDTVVIENNRWEEVPKHWSGNDRMEIDAGSANVMIRNNVIDATNAAAINVSTFMPQTFSTGTVTRVVKNLQILSNTVVNSGTNGAFLSVGGGQQNVITLKDSLYVAQDFNVGPNANAAVHMNSRNDLLNFTKLSSGGGINGNVWNLPAEAKTHGGELRVGQLCRGIGLSHACPSGRAIFRGSSGMTRSRNCSRGI